MKRKDLEEVPVNRIRKIFKTGSKKHFFNASINLSNKSGKLMT